jgi:hypothetical protein
MQGNDVYENKDMKTISGDNVILIVLSLYS